MASDSESESRSENRSPRHQIRDQVALTRRRASEAVSRVHDEMTRLNDRLVRFKNRWYNRIDPFLYYDSTYKYKLIPELYLTAVSVAFFALSAIIMSLMNGLADFRHPGAYRLPDMGFSFIPEITSRPNLPNEILGIAVLATFILVVSHPKRLMVFRRLLVIYSVILLLRALCVTSTSLPDPSPQCRDLKQFNQNSPSHPLRPEEQSQSFWRGVRQTMMPLQSTTCGDLIFSGHTVAFILCSLIWDRYFTGQRSRWPVFLFHLVTAAGLYSIIAVRFHYTIDVVVAIIVTVSVWGRYHIFVDYRQLYYETSPLRGRSSSFKMQSEGQEDGIIKVFETGDYTHLLPRKEAFAKKKD